MSKFRIALLPGDGIGVDVMDAARIVLEELKLDAEYITGEIGWEYWCKEGNPLPERTLDLLKSCHCALFGAITSKPKEEAMKELSPELKTEGIAYRSPIVTMRQMFDLYNNMRPCKSYLGNSLNYRDDIDLVVFRENTEGLYSGVEFYPLPDVVRDALENCSSPMKRFNEIKNEEMAVALRIITQKGAHRIIRKAFEYAKRFNYPSVTIVEKPNILRETSGMMIREARSISKDFPGIELKENNIDAQMMWLLKNPEKYGVMVTSNMFGDILSDLSAQLVGGLGFACSGNIGDSFAIFEPTHGSAPKYAGKYKVNPIAMVLAIKLMLDWLGENGLAQALDKAVATTVAEGKVRTYDMGGDSSTLDMVNEIVSKLD